MTDTTELADYIYSIAISHSPCMKQEDKINAIKGHLDILKESAVLEYKTKKREREESALIEVRNPMKPRTIWILIILTAIIIHLCWIYLVL